MAAFGFFNGTGQPYAASGQGRFRWNGGRSFSRDPDGTICLPNSLLPDGGVNHYAKTPRVLKVGSELWAYVDHKNRASIYYGVRRFTTTDLTGQSGWVDRGLVLDIPDASNVEAFPIVIRDPDETDPAQRFKMWYGTGYTAGAHVVKYAYSADGISWTTWGTVISNTQAWEFSSSSGGRVFMFPASIVRLDGEWFLYYAARYGGAPGTAAYHWRGGVARFTNPKSTYTTKSQVIDNAPYYSKATLLTSNPSAGATSFTVASGATYSPGDPIYIGTASTIYNRELRNVQSIVGNTITLTSPLSFSYAAGDGTVHAMSRSVFPSCVWRDDSAGNWKMLVTVFEAGSGNEDQMLAEAAGPAGPWSFVMASSPVFARVSPTRWDGQSAENSAFIADDADPIWSFLYETSATRVTIVPATETDTAQALSFGLRASGLTLDPGAFWQQSGTVLTVHAIVGSRREATGVVTSSTGGELAFRGTDAAEFEVSLNGEDWAASVTVPAGDTPVWLSAEPSATGILSAELGVPA